MKTDPSCELLDQVSPNRIADIRIHDNLIERTTYEGMDLGYFDVGTVMLSCGALRSPCSPRDWRA